MLYFHQAKPWVRFCLQRGNRPRVAVRWISSRQKVIQKSNVYSEDNPFVKVSEEIRAAIEAEKPVVALETAIYTHGTYGDRSWNLNDIDFS